MGGRLLNIFLVSAPAHIRAHAGASIGKYIGRVDV